MEFIATKDCAQFIIPACKLVPDKHHGNASRKTDHDQTYPVLRKIRKEYPCKEKHQHRTDHPVLDNRCAECFSLLLHFRVILRISLLQGADTSSR